MIETPAGMLNAIGLQNVGVEVFLSDKLPRLRELPVRVVVNCWGNSEDEYEDVVARLEGAEGIDAIELNLACPNKKEWQTIFACDPGLTARITARVRKRTRAPLWVKLSPNVTDIRESARAAAGEGADALCLVNTLRGMAIDIESRAPIIGNNQGGLSGPAIKPVAVLKTHQVYQVCRDHGIPIIGQGGVTTADDALEFLIAGASAVGVGTALFYDPLVCKKINDGIVAYLERHELTEVSQLVGTLVLNG